MKRLFSMQVLLLLVILFMLGRLVTAHEHKEEKKKRYTPTPTQHVIYEPSATPTFLCLSVTPTQAITPTPTETNTPTPTVTPIENVGTPEATIIPQSNTTTTSSNDTPKSDPSCHTDLPEDTPHIWITNEVLGDNNLTVHWNSNTKYDTVHIRYSEVDGEWRYALLDTKDDGQEEISYLKNNTHYWFQAAYVRGCAVGNYSQSFDPVP